MSFHCIITGMIVVFQIFSFGCFMKPSYEEKEMSSCFKGKEPCFFTGYDVEKLFENQGFGDDYDSINYITVVNNALIIKLDNGHLYVINDNRKIRYIGKHYKGDYYVTQSYKVKDISDIEIDNNFKRLRWVSYDRNSRFIGCNYKSDNYESDRYRIIEIKSKKTIIDRSGYLFLLDSNSKELYFIAGHYPEGKMNYYKLYKYNVNNLNEVYNVILKRPRNLYNKLKFLAVDIDTENELIAFNAYYPGLWFSFQKSLRPEMWVYDIEQDKYIYRRIFQPSDRLFQHYGIGYIRFLPDSLCKLLQSQ